MAGIPTVETVIRLGDHPQANGAVMISRARSTLSRLSMGSPSPMKTRLETPHIPLSEGEREDAIASISKI